MRKLLTVHDAGNIKDAIHLITLWKEVRAGVCARVCLCGHVCLCMCVSACMCARAMPVCALDCGEGGGYGCALVH